MRGGVLELEALKAYSSRLAKERLDDVLMALEKLAEMPRGEYESAIPEIGGILQIVQVMAIARQNRNVKEYHQQQICLKCKSVAEMMRPIGEQFRTWCMPCQTYRKIVPEDLALTEGQWNMLCYELDQIYRQWVKEGSDPTKCIDPQFDRDSVI